MVPRNRWPAAALALLLTFVSAGALSAQDRFPRPEFRSEYVTPTIDVPNAPDSIFEYVDLAVLVAAVAVMTAVVLKLRSRPAVLALSVFSIAYFGFIREGCICPVGSIQNVALAIADPGYAIPVSVVGFFLVPLLTALLFGRTFCAGVCPLGALQDLVVLKPVRLPRAAAAVLGVIPFAYLGLAVLLAVAGSGFIVCRFDPFVEIFRLGSRLEAFAGAAVLLGIGVFVARPYCRFLCPYGALLSVLSRFSWKHTTVTPTECVECRLCETACPFDAILVPPPPDRGEGRRADVRRLAVSLAFIPLLAIAGGFAGRALEGFFLSLSPDDALRSALAVEKKTGTTDSIEETRLFRETGTTEAGLAARVERTRAVLGPGSAVFGAFLGLVIALKILGLAIPPRHRGYVPDRAACLSCARCHTSCPEEHLRLKRNKEKPAGGDA